jgi:hypothetical protein
MRFLLPLLLAAAVAAQADDTASALIARGTAHEDAGRLPEAERDYDAARVTAERSGSAEDLAEALAALGYVQ